MNAGLGAFAVEFVVLLAELLALLVLVSALLGLLVRRVGMPRLQAWLGGGRVRGAAKGVALGFITPFCTYSAIPVVFAMVDAHLRVSTLTGFLLASPLLDPIVVAVLVLLFGWQPAAAYVVVTVAAVFGAALLADAAHLDRHLRPAARRTAVPVLRVDPDRTPQIECSPTAVDPYTDPAPWRGWRPEARAAFAYSLDLTRGLAVPIVLAVAVAAAIIGVVPEQLIARLAGPDNPAAVPTAALLGAPFYVSTEAFLPIAAALHERGMALGATFALVISAAGVNLPELGLLSRIMTPWLLTAYAVAVIAVAITAGYLIPLLA